MASIFAKYNNWLNRKPALANSLTTGFLFGAGDFIAQVGFPSQDKTEVSSLSSTTTTTTKLKYDYLRTLRGVLYGAMIFSPIAGRLYPYLNNNIFFPNLKFKSKLSLKNQRLLDTTARVSVDQLVWAPIGIPLYYTCITIMEGGDTKKIKEKLDENYKETLTNNWKVWPVFQMCNFYFVPVEYRLLTVNVISILWNCYLSYENTKANNAVTSEK